MDQMFTYIKIPKIGLTANKKTIDKHGHAKRAGVILSIDWVAWGKTGC